MVEYVKGFSAEFEGHVLPDSEVLEQGHVEVSLAGIAQDVPAGITRACNTSASVA